MGGFASSNQDYKAQSNSVFDTSIKTENYVSSNSLSSSDSSKKTTTDTETVDLDADVTSKKYSSESDTSKSSGDSTGEASNVKAEEVTDFSYKQYDDSVIEEYLKTCGDVNGDGKIDSKDVKILQEGLAGSKDISKGDIDGDGKVTVKDASLLQKFVEGGGYVPPTIEIANKLDQIKYQKTKTAVEDELHKKYAERKKIDSSIKYYNKVNQKKKSTPTHSTDSGWHSGYVGGKKKKSTKKKESDYFPGGCEANERNKYFYETYKKNKASEAEEAKYKKDFGSLNNARDFYDNNIASLNYEKQQLDRQIKLTPYENRMATADFKKWSNSHTIDDFDPTKNDKLNKISKYKDSYKYLDIYQISMYNYLLDTEGEEVANKYLDILEDDINRQKGYEEAQKFADRLDKNFSKIIKEDGTLMDSEDIAAADKLYNAGKYDKKYDMDGDGDLDKDDLTKLNQYIETGGEITTSMKNLQISFDQGFGDGIIKFGEGIKNMFVNSDVLSTEEYKMMFITQMLEQNGVVKGSYEFGSTVGNMVPVIVASAIMTAATAPFGGEGGALFAVGGYTVTASTVGKMTAATLIFASTYGNSKHEALVNGHSLESAVGYGILSGISEAGLETLLGSIPFVGKESRSLLVSMFKEGLSESAQELASSVIGYYTLGEEIDISQMSADMGKAFVYGAMLSGLGNVGKGVANMKVLVNGVRYELTGAQIMEYYKASVDPKTGKSNGLTLQQYIAENLSSDSKAATNSNIMTVDQISSMSQYERSDAITKILSENTSGKFSDVEITNLKNLMNNLDSETRTATLNKMSSTNLLATIKALNSAGDVKLLNSIFDSSNANTQYMTTLTKTLLDPTLDYYENAAKIAGNLSAFQTYRSHTEGHVKEVAVKTLEAANNIKTSLEKSGVDGFSSDVNLYECYVAALWHDVGMAAGSEGMLSYDSKVVDGKIVTETLKEKKNGNVTRSNHSFNSAINVLANSSEIAALGVDPNNVALLTFAHSKSNSGVSVLNNAKDWSLCVDKINSAVEYHNQTHPDSKIVFSNTGGTNFIESLIKSGILKDDSTTTYTSSTKQGKVTHNVYNFDPAKLSALSSETYAIRLGDANTNNNNIGTNQAGQKIDMSTLERKGKTSFDTSAGFGNIESLVDSEATGSTIKIGDETVTLNTFGAAYILGEANIDFSTDVSDGGALTERFTIRNPSEYPASTVFNIDERLGEVATADKGGFKTKMEICLSSKDVPEASKPQIEAYYKAFAESRGYDSSCVVWV